MLALDDPAWGDLTHAYGSAADVPALLRAIAAAPGPGAAAEPWFILWSSLCHQGDVYEASYAAVPHFVRIATDAAGAIDSSFFHLPAAIEVARHGGRGPIVQAGLERDYRAAIAALADCVALRRSEDWDKDDLICVCAALAAAKGQHALAEAIMNLDDDWIAKINACDFD